MPQKHFLVLLLLISFLADSTCSELRQLEGNDQDATSSDEERTLSAKLAAVVEKLKYKSWLSTDTTPKAVLSKLETSGKQVTESKLIPWLIYVVKYQAKHSPDAYFGSSYYIFYTLAEKLPEEKLVKLLVSMRKNPELENLAKELQQMQNMRWLDNDVNPDQVKLMLGVVTQGRSKAELRQDPAYNIWSQYSINYIVAFVRSVNH